MNKKNDASAVASLNASSQSSGQSIPQTSASLQGKKNAWKQKKRSCLSIDSKVPSMAIKIYEEQLAKGFDYLCNAIRSTDKRDFQVLAIVHDRDTYADDGHFWKPAVEKPHMHVIVRCVDRKKRIRVRTILNALGIYFRPNLDDELWEKHGVETVGDFSSYAMYLTHETDAAINAAKELYDISEIISNLDIDEIQAVRDGYLRLSSAKKKVTDDDLIQLDAAAYELGRELGNFDKWYDALPFNIRSHSKMKTIRESYKRGVDARVAEQSEVTRVCIYIQGEHNTGKTYAAKHALAGKTIHTVEGGGSGKFDNLRADHDAIIISDDVCPNVLNMTDNYICRAYKRQNNNPAWSGQYFIVTSNLSFKDWLKQCKIDVNGKHYEAMVSRFYICEIRQKPDGTNYLALKSASTRGTVEEQSYRAGLFLEFQKKFNALMADYNPTTDTFDYADMIDPCFEEEASQRIQRESQKKTKFAEEENRLMAEAKSDRDALLASLGT